jgi:hypothetical protein
MMFIWRSAPADEVAGDLVLDPQPHQKLADCRFRSGRPGFSDRLRTRTDNTPARRSSTRPAARRPGIPRTLTEFPYGRITQKYYKRYDYTAIACFGGLRVPHRTCETDRSTPYVRDAGMRLSSVGPGG